MSSVTPTVNPNVVYHALLAAFGRRVTPSLIATISAIPSLRALFENSMTTSDLLQYLDCGDHDAELTLVLQMRLYAAAIFPSGELSKFGFLTAFIDDVPATRETRKIALGHIVSFANNAVGASALDATEGFLETGNYLGTYFDGACFIEPSGPGSFRLCRDPQGKLTSLAKLMETASRAYNGRAPKWDSAPYSRRDDTGLWAGTQGTQLLLVGGPHPLIFFRSLGVYVGEGIIQTHTPRPDGELLLNGYKLPSVVDRHETGFPSYLATSVTASFIGDALILPTEGIEPSSPFLRNGSELPWLRSLRRGIQWTFEKQLLRVKLPEDGTEVSPMWFRRCGRVFEFPYCGPMTVAQKIFNVWLTSLRAPDSYFAFTGCSRVSDMYTELGCRIVRQAKYELGGFSVGGTANTFECMSLAASAFLACASLAMMTNSSPIVTLAVRTEHSILAHVKDFPLIEDQIPVLCHHPDWMSCVVGVAALPHTPVIDSITGFVRTPETHYEGWECIEQLIEVDTPLFSVHVYTPYGRSDGSASYLRTESDKFLHSLFALYHVVISPGNSLLSGDIWVSCSRKASGSGVMSPSDKVRLQTFRTIIEKVQMGAVLASIARRIAARHLLHVPHMMLHGLWISIYGPHVMSALTQGHSLNFGNHEPLRLTINTNPDGVSK